MRALALIGAVSLTGCVTTATPDAGAWKIERGHDRIVDRPAATAQLTAPSRNERQQQLRYPQVQLQIASLQLGCFDNAPVVRLAFNHRVGSNRTSTLSYRFDDNPGRDVPARFLQTYATVLIEDPAEVARFVDQLRVSNALYVRIMSHIAGTSTVEFSLKGAPMAIDAAYQACPIDSRSKPRTAVAPMIGASRSVPA
ncbi:MAG: hypothetical protein AB7V13_23695 [Pseudorhodoplanes sp.]|uniref:hypothetical protein n=1 Tax=Pseudorhodoplanes sp. TaxID=1934341 RepID=UPI003D12A6A9